MSARAYEQSMLTGVAEIEPTEENAAGSSVEAAEQLISLGRDQGFITYDDVLLVFPEAETNLEQLDDLFANLFEQGIEVSAFRGEEEREEPVEEEPAEVEQFDLDLTLIDIDDSISLYLKEIGRVPLLTAEEEVSLAKRMERGKEARQRLTQGVDDPTDRERLLAAVKDGQAAQEHLIKANSRLVVSVAKKYVGRGVPFLDLIRGQHQTDPRRQEVRLPPRLQVQHLRHLVDSPGSHTRHRRPGTHHSRAGAYVRADQPSDTHEPPVGARARP